MHFYTITHIQIMTAGMITSHDNRGEKAATQNYGILKSEFNSGQVKQGSRTRWDSYRDVDMLRWFGDLQSGGNSWNFWGKSARRI